MNKKITVDNHLIRIVINRSGEEYAATSNEYLIDILNKNELSAYTDERKVLNFTVWNGRKHYSLADIAYACYGGWITDADKYDVQMEAFIEYKRREDLTVDHLDNNVHNNTQYNLSLMKAAVNNGKKRDLTSKFIGNYGLSCAYVDGEYRVCFCGYEFFGVEMRFVCGDAEELVNMLKTLHGTTIKGVTSVSALDIYLDRRGKENVAHTSSELCTAIKKQELLAALDRGGFQEWKGGYITNNELTIKTIKIMKGAAQ